MSARQSDRRGISLPVAAIGLVAILALGVGLWRFAGAAGGVGGGVVVTEKDFTFVPRTLTVREGETVTFRNEDRASHSVNIGGVDLGKQARGESKVWEAGRPATYLYRCTIHTGMSGRIVVE